MKIIYIEKDKMRHLFVKEGLKNYDVDFFILNKLDEEFYMLEDIKPDSLLIDLKSINDSPGFLEKILNIQALSESRLYLIGDFDSSLFDVRFIKINNPIEIETIVKITKKS